MGKGLEGVVAASTGISYIVISHDLKPLEGLVTRTLTLGIAHAS